VGLGVLLAGVGTWSVLAGAALIRATQGREWRALLALRERPRIAVGLAGAASFGVVLCVTHLGALSATAIGLGALVAAAAVAGYERFGLRRPGRAAGIAADVVAVGILLLAIPDVVIFRSSPVPPNIYFPPGVIQFQQDWLLGPANQLLHGGALLVNVPSSQYGVGPIYLLVGWFHLLPIGYGTFGLLDGILTALFYAAGYCVLRIAGVGRLLASAVLAFAVAVLLYHLPYSVGALPEQGPLRFGLPMLVILAAVVGARAPSRGRATHLVSLALLGLASIWAIEAFAYTAFTLAAILALEAALRPAGGRGRWLARQAGLALAACVCAQAALALATLAGTGHLPDWTQYLAYLRGLLLGGREGGVTYGFPHWSPGLAMGAACLASAAAIVLLIARARPVASVNRTRLVALTGLTAYAIASFSYTDNRSNTYLFPYVALPVLLLAVLWLTLLMGDRELSLARRRSALAAALSVGVLMVAAAWSTIEGNFRESALARAYPSGGLSSALSRLWHPPPIDPRAPGVVRLLRRYFPGRRALIVLPDAPDLALESLMRSGKAISLYLGDPAMDMWNPSLWIPRVSRQLASLPPGTRVLTDRIGLTMAAQLRGHPDNWALGHPVVAGTPELEWIMHRLDQRYRIVPVHHGPGEFLVAKLYPRVGAP